MTALHVIKTVLKLLLFIVLLPILIFVVLIRLWHFRKVLVRNLIESGMPEEYAKQLGKEAKPGKMVNWRPI